MKAPTGAQLPGANSPLIAFMGKPGQGVKNNPDNVRSMLPGGPRIMGRMYGMGVVAGAGDDDVIDRGGAAEELDAIV